ncbi:MAG: lipase [Chloroflexaceae bacterium]|nr:lipase [Chloroflexaceae bacterium]
MYRFQVSAHTTVGEAIGLVGSTPQLGQWDTKGCIRLQTSPDRYPLWWADIDLESDRDRSGAGHDKIEYKYVRLGARGSAIWEALGTNRWVPLETTHDFVLIVDDREFAQVQPWPYGYPDRPLPQALPPQETHGQKILVVGSSVAMGCSAWMLRGWAWLLGQTLGQKYGHHLVSRCVLGANVAMTLQRLPALLAQEQPDLVIIALSLGNEGLAYCSPGDRQAVQDRFERGLQKLLQLSRAMGIKPVLGGVYPHDNYGPEQYQRLRETQARMLSWDVPVLDWLAVLDDGTGRWRRSLSFDAAHPNSEGHRLMYEAIDLSLFKTPESLAPQGQPPTAIPVYSDGEQFQAIADSHQQLRVVNTSPYPYTITPTWQQFQSALRTHGNLHPGVYIAQDGVPGSDGSFFVGEDGRIETVVTIGPRTCQKYRTAACFFAPQTAQILFYDGQLALLKEGSALRAINESEHSYNIHPMWQEVRSLLKAMPPGVYHDPLQPDAPFRTLIVGPDGLENRVKALPQSAVLFEYKCPLSEISRIGIVPLGDRCAARMLLYKMEYDGPAFPFDLTRTTNLSDIADMIASGFDDMWNPAYLYYDAEARRLYHRKWTGLSFGHEVEDWDDPISNIFPVFERMRNRYSARAARFWYVIDKSDKLLFVRTGVTERGNVIDLMAKLRDKCQGKPFQLLLLSPQSSGEFANLSQVLHYNLEFNPDRMYAELDYWLDCTEILRNILNSLGITSNNLFWCPPKIPRAA